jgi:hypothetical protein
MTGLAIESSIKLSMILGGKLRTGLDGEFRIASVIKLDCVRDKIWCECDRDVYNKTLVEVNSPIRCQVSRQNNYRLYYRLMNMGEQIYNQIVMEHIK